MRITFLILLIIAQPAAVFNQTARAPEFSLRDLRGKRVRLSDYRGKIVLINFWATWCAPCRAEMRDLVEWQNEFKDRGLQILGVTHPPYRGSRVRRAVRQLRIDYPILLGTRQAASRYGVNEILPITIVVDREGNIADRITGILDQQEFDEKVKPRLEARD